jgi:hypothetical protein
LPPPFSSDVAEHFFLFFVLVCEIACCGCGPAAGNEEEVCCTLLLLFVVAPLPSMLTAENPDLVVVDSGGPDELTELFSRLRVGINLMGATAT